MCRRSPGDGYSSPGASWKAQATPKATHLPFTNQQCEHTGRTPGAPFPNGTDWKAAREAIGEGIGWESFILEVDYNYL
jgi:hypothetical protein